MPTTDIEFVLDASALLAYLQGEPGADLVQLTVDRSAVTSPNWSEVCQKALSRALDIIELRSAVESLGVEILPFTADDAQRAASLWPMTRRAGLSMGDRACLALAQRLGIPALTADRSWLALGLDVEVRPIR